MRLNMFNSVQPRLAEPNVPVDSSTVKLWGQVTNTLSDFSNRALQDWQEATVNAASKEGAIEGIKENPVFREGSSLSAQAFNTTAAKNYVASLEVKAAAAMADIQVNNAYNPSGYKKSADAYISKMTETLLQNPATADFAGVMKTRLQLQSQAESYKISKNYMALQGEETKAQNEDLMASASQSAYMAASGVFSKDPAVQNSALGAYTLNKQILETALRAVLPDGTPLYPPMAVQKRLEKYHQDFFIKGTQAYLSDNVSTKDLKALTDGTFSVTIPGGQKVDIIREVGIDAYEKQIRNFAFEAIKAKEAEFKRVDAANESLSKEMQKVNGLETISALLSGSKQMTTESIISDFKAGKLSPSDAMAAVKLASDPEAGVSNSPVVADLALKIIDGEDVEDQIRQLAKGGNIMPSTLSKLLKDNAKAQQGVVDDNKRFIKQLVVEKDVYGIEDPKTLRHAYDMQQQYDHMVHVEGLTPELALEKVRNNIDVIKARSNKGKYNSVPLYMVTGADNQIDLKATAAETYKKYKDGKISKDQYEIEKARLRQLKNERDTR